MMVPCFVSSAGCWLLCALLLRMRLTHCNCNGVLFCAVVQSSSSFAILDRLNHHHYQSSPSPLLFSSHQLSAIFQCVRDLFLLSLAEASRPNPVAVLGAVCLSHIHTKLPRKGAFPDNHLSTSFTPSRRNLSSFTHLRALSSSPTIPDLPNPTAASHTIIIAIL